MKDSPVSSTVDFEKDGIQHGFLKLPHSHDDSAWGSIIIPITVAKNGVGPTILFTGANHGDEYEGPIALFDLANEINPQEISGRVIIIPGMNYPAFQAGKRTSPIDGGNMNRVFPGDPEGNFTQKIADYFTRTLLPLADYVVDFHSGGKTMEFLPFCATHILQDKKQQSLCIAAMKAFNAPHSVMLLEIDAANMYDTAAENMGKIFISTELGGGGSTTAYTVGIAKKGIRNILRHSGITKGAMEVDETLNLDMPDDSCYVFSETSGLVEHCVDLGEEVKAGQIVAKIHNLERTGSPSKEYLAGIDGIYTGRHFPGLIAAGDFLGVISVQI